MIYKIMFFKILDKIIISKSKKKCKFKLKVYNDKNNIKIISI